MLVLLLLPAALSAPLLMVAQKAETQPDIKPVRATVNLVLVDAIVTDPKGNTANGLSPEDFVLLDEQAKQPIMHFSRDEFPMAIALVVDTSGSMAGLFESLRRGVLKSLKKLKASDRVVLFSFQHHVKRETDLQGDPKKLAQRIQALSVGGGTDINAALYEAAAYLAKVAPEERHVVVLVSDNLSSGGARTNREVSALVRETNATVFSLQLPILGPSAHTVQMTVTGVTPEVAKQIAQLLQGFNPHRSPFVPLVVEESGGALIDVHKEDGVEPALDSLLHLLKTRYTLGYYPSDGAEPGSLRKLEVQLAPQARARFSDHIILSRNSYVTPRER
jgi:VWFA-related protein